MTTTSPVWRLALVAGLANLLVVPVAVLVSVRVLDRCGAGGCGLGDFVGVIGILLLTGPLGAAVAYVATWFVWRSGRHSVEPAPELLAWGLFAYAAGSVLIWGLALDASSAGNWIWWLPLAYFVLGPPGTVGVIVRRSMMDNEHRTPKPVP